MSDRHLAFWPPQQPRHLTLPRTRSQREDRQSGEIYDQNTKTPTSSVLNSTSACHEDRNRRWQPLSLRSGEIQMNNYLECMYTNRNIR